MDVSYESRSSFDLRGVTGIRQTMINNMYHTQDLQQVLIDGRKFNYSAATPSFSCTMLYERYKRYPSVPTSESAYIDYYCVQYGVFTPDIEGDWQLHRHDYSLRIIASHPNFAYDQSIFATILILILTRNSLGFGIRNRCLWYNIGISFTNCRNPLSQDITCTYTLAHRRITVLL